MQLWILRHLFTLSLTHFFLSEMRERETKTGAIEEKRQRVFRFGEGISFFSR